jgi:7,8-dihydropterin-6-yl-methyl-4-(beta-D-ribofuranosyl)aminobenzene 5'-phosphate synthase
VPDSLIAEPGFSALVRIERDGRHRTLLFDTGVSANGIVENMRRLGVSSSDIEVIVLSHGHWDHVTGMEGLVGALRPYKPAGDDPLRVLEPAADQLPRP